ncbi:uncharacterized protein LOC126267742 [Schistocerca gregaria]|uniref:uncharacterized protein LOC126267742 n=1 Tax=Schistocerca gregaria TaxID=7010 RepID=UPI00211E5807|nr:uncharacterized protein LOC126267742 [Schistocerca gregaria]
MVLHVVMYSCAARCWKSVARVGESQRAGRVSCRRLGPEWRDRCFILGYGVASPVQNDSHVARYMVQRVWTRIGCVDDPPYESYLCAVKDVFNKTTCEGDMGGPLMCSTAPNGHGLFGIVDGRIAMRTRVMDLDCVLPQRENRYLSAGYYQ